MNCAAAAWLDRAVACGLVRRLAHLLGPRLLPAPQAVVLAIIHEARTGALGFNLGVTLLRVLVSFTIAMALGTFIGIGNGPQFLPSTGLLTLAGGAAQPAGPGDHRARLYLGRADGNRGDCAVALNKLPIATVTVREGARALDPTLDEMATVFRMGGWVRLRHVVLPQLAPYLRRRPAPGCRWCGRSC